MKPIQGWIVRPDGKLDFVTAYRDGWTPGGSLQYQVTGGGWVQATELAQTKRKARKLVHRRIRRTAKRIANLQRGLTNLTEAMGELK